MTRRIINARISSFVFLTFFSFAHYSPAETTNVCDESLSEKIRINALQKIEAQSKTKSETPEIQKSLPAQSGSTLKQGVQYFLLNRVYGAQEFAAKGFRGFIDAFRKYKEFNGNIERKYITGQDRGPHEERWAHLEELVKNGEYHGSFGHTVHPGTVGIMSNVVPPTATAMESVSIGQDFLVNGKLIPIKKIKVDAMVSQSGMSYPQLSSKTHLSLLYTHIKMAKENNVRYLYNSGEGGPLFHLALLEGNEEKLMQQVLKFGTESGNFNKWGWDEAKAKVFVRRLFETRNELFAEFTPEDILKAQIVAQFGPALNGIRMNDSAMIDFNQLKEIGNSPYVSMIQFKLKQAAKRGAKLNVSKVNNIVAFFRGIHRNHPPVIPDISPEMDSYESIAEIILATKTLTQKPVSLKFGIGNTADLLDLMTYLKEADALPDHIQVDGRGEGFSPGSGNAPPVDDTSLPSSPAVIALDAILKKLQIRDKIYIEATGDILEPADAIEKLALGADGVAAGRFFMGTVGCSMVKECASGNCPYGIAAADDSMFAKGFVVKSIAPKAYEAVKSWRKTYAQLLSETNTDWRKLRLVHGLSSEQGIIRKQQEHHFVSLQKYYPKEIVYDYLKGALTPAEVDHLVYGEL